MRTLGWKDYIGAAILDPIIILYTGIMASISVVISIFDDTGRGQHACARIWAKFVLWLCRTRVDVSGLSNIPRDRPCVFAANHQSTYDIWVLLASLPVQFRFTPKKVLFDKWFLGWHLRRAGNIPIDRSNPKAALRSVRAAAERVRNGTSVLLFPEGSRSEDGELLPFKKGGFLLAHLAEVPVVPIAISGTGAIMPKRSLVIRPGPVRMEICPPIESTDYRADELERFSEDVRRAIENVIIADHS